MDLPGLRPAPTKATSQGRAPLGTCSLTFLTAMTTVWPGLLGYRPFKVCICAVYLLSLGTEVKYQSRKEKKIASACWHSDLKRASFVSVGVFDLCILYWPSQLAWAVSHLALKFPFLSDCCLCFYLQVFPNCVTLYPSSVVLFYEYKYSWTQTSYQEVPGTKVWRIASCDFSFHPQVFGRVLDAGFC